MVIVRGYRRSDQVKNPGKVRPERVYDGVGSATSSRDSNHVRALMEHHGTPYGPNTKSPDPLAPSGLESRLDSL